MSIERIREVVVRAPELGEVGEWLAAALKRYLDTAPHGLTLDAALGVATPRGSRPWWRAEARRQRDVAIARLRDLLPRVESYRSEVDGVVAALRRYHRARWRLDRTVAPRGDPFRIAMRAVLSADGKVPSRQVVETACKTVDLRSPISACAERD